MVDDTQIFLQIRKTDLCAWLVHCPPLLNRLGLELTAVDYKLLSVKTYRTKFQGERRLPKLAMRAGNNRLFRFVCGLYDC